MVSIIPSFGTDPTHKMLSRFKFLGRQESQTAVTVAFKIGPINATDKISIGRSQNLLHVIKRSKSVSRAEEIKSLWLHMVYLVKFQNSCIHGHLVYDMGLE